MNTEDLEGSYHRNHTVQVEIDGQEQPVAILYLDNLKKSLGGRVKISKEESDKATAYLKAHKDREAETAKIEAAAKRNASKEATKKTAKK